MNALLLPGITFPHWLPRYAYYRMAHTAHTCPLIDCYPPPFPRSGALRRTALARFPPPPPLNTRCLHAAAPAHTPTHRTPARAALRSDPAYPLPSWCSTFPSWFSSGRSFHFAWWVHCGCSYVFAHVCMFTYFVPRVLFFTVPDLILRRRWDAAALPHPTPTPAFPHHGSSTLGWITRCSQRTVPHTTAVRFGSHVLCPVLVCDAGNLRLLVVWLV